MPIVYPVTQLDSDQVLRYSFDEDLQALRTSSTATISTTGSFEVSIDNVTDSIAIGTSANLFTGTDVGPKHALDVNIAAGGVTGTLNPVGLKEILATTALIVTDTAIKIPPYPVSGRNSLSVRVWGSQTVYFGASGVGVLITDPNPGYPKRQFEEITIDIQSNPNVDLWAICPAGTSSELRIMEVG